MSTRIAFLGHGAMAPDCMEAVARDGHVRLSGVFIHPSRRPGADHENTHMVRIAEEHGMQAVSVESVSEMVVPMEAAAPDLIVSVGFLKIVPPEILSIAPYGGINLHGALLPKYRGRAPLSWALINGENVVGLTVHYMDAGVDSGDILLQLRIKVLTQDTAETLYEKMRRVAPELLIEAVKLFAHGAPPGVPQDHSVATIYGKITPEVCLIRWDEPAMKVYDLIRALVKPYPGAYTFHHGRKVFIWKAMPMKGATGSCVPGEILEKNPRGVVVAAGEGTLQLEEIQEEGGVPQIPDWETGEILTGEEQ